MKSIAVKSVSEYVENKGIKRILNKARRVLLTGLFSHEMPSTESWALGQLAKFRVGPGTQEGWTRSEFRLPHIEDVK